MKKLLLAATLLLSFAATGCSTLMPATHNYLTSEKVDDIREGNGEGCMSYVTMTRSDGSVATFTFTGNNCGPGALE